MARSGHVRTAGAALALLAAGVGVVACGDEESITTTTGTEAAGVDVVAREYLYEMPAEVEGGWVTFNLANEGVAPHEYGLGQIGQGHTPEELDAAIDDSGAPPRWVEEVVTFGTQTPGASISMTLDLEPGNYAFLCFLPTADGKTHLELGMHQGFAVGADSGASPPQPDGTITATKDGFSIPDVAAGEQTLEVQPEDPEGTTLELAVFEPGEDLAGLEKWFRGGLEGEAPATLYGGPFLSSDDPVFLAAEFESGTTYSAVNPDTGVQQDFTVD